MICFVIFLFNIFHSPNYRPFAINLFIHLYKKFKNMKPKTTLNLLIDFFSNIIQKTILIFSAFFGKKVSLIPIKIAYIFFFIFYAANSYSQSNSCQAKLIVDHNLNTGSASTTGAYYLMIITNSGSSTDTFTLSASNVNATCSNSDGSSTAGNVNLETSFVDANLIPITEISLSPGQSINFYSRITIPTGSNIKKWCCTQVFAESKTCSNYKVSTVLHTYYSGPNED
jgi:hypothetical protein